MNIGLSYSSCSRSDNGIPVFVDRGKMYFFLKTSQY